MAGPYTYTSTGTGNWSTVARWTGGQGTDYPGKIYAITGAANNGSGLIRLTISSTATFVTGDTVHVSGVLGTTEAVGLWVVTVISGTTLDLQSSTFTNAYVSGGKLARNDKVVINSAITKDVAVDFGMSPTDATPANNYVLTINNGAGKSLTLDNTEMRVRGGINDAQSATYGIIWGAGANVVVDATLASSAMKYPYRIASTFNSGTNVRGWDVNGTTNAHCTFSSAGDGTRNAYYLHGNNGGEGTVDAEYFDLVNIGDSANNAMRPIDSQRAQTLRLSNVTVDRCGQILIAIGATAPATLSIDGLTSTNSRVDESSTYVLNLANSSSNSISLNRLSFDKKWWPSTPAGITVNNSYFAKGWAATTGAVLWTKIQNTFIRYLADPPLIPGSLDTIFFFRDQPAGTNCHGLNVYASTPKSSSIAWNNVWYYLNSTDATGEAFFANAPANAFSLSIKNCVVLPNGGGTSSGALFASGSAANEGFRVTLEHNTANIKGNTGLEIGHLYTTPDSRFASTKSNLLIGDGTSYKLVNVDAVATADFLDPATVDYNAGFGTLATDSGSAGWATNQGRGYIAKWSVTPGANDVDGVDPRFVDSTRSLATWAATRGSVSGKLAGKEADAIAYIAADPTLTASSLIPYLAAGWAPTSSALRNAGHDGATIGAVEWVAGGIFSAAGGSSCLNYCEV